MIADLAWRLIGLASAGALLANAPMAAASAATTVTIQFQRGAICWRYAGSATTFNGTFKAGQRLDITSTGDSEEGNGRENWSETISRQIYIALGKDGKLLTPDSSGYFTIPKAGLYQVSFGPQAVVGAPGTMIVCTI